jgi:hypothetical protein
MLRDLTSIHGVAVDLTALLTALAAFYAGEDAAIWFAVALGVVASAPRPNLMPWEILSLTGIAASVNLIRVKLNLDTTASKMFLLAAALLAHGIVISAVISFEDFSYILLRYILPGAVYSMMAGWILIAAANKVVRPEKLRT